jgi:hypothetical protein
MVFARVAIHSENRTSQVLTANPCFIKEAH